MTSDSGVESLPGTHTNRHRSGSRVEREAALALLTLCLAEDDALSSDEVAELIQRSSTRVVLQAAEYHRVGGLAYMRLRTLDVPDTLLQGLREMYTQAVHHHMRILWALARLQPILERSDARWAVVKGPALVELAYGDPGRRTYSDLDVLVEPRRFRDVVSQLESAGIKLLDRNWKVIRREAFGELHFLLPGSLLLDLHWSLVTIYRGRTSMNSTEILDRRQRVVLAGIPAWSLDPIDTALHVAVHAALSGADKLIWTKDIDLALRIMGSDWQTLGDRAERWGVAAPVGLMLLRTAKTLGTPVPAGLADRLLGHWYRAILAFVDRISPWQQAFGRVTTPSLLLARSIGQGPLGSAAWLARRSIRNLDPREPIASLAFTPRGSAADREAFFEAVISAESPARDAAIRSGGVAREKETSGR
jgi:hypothetical protein